MLFLILAVIVVIAAFVIIGMVQVEDYDGKFVTRKNFWSLLGLLILIPGFFTIVPANNVGVVYSITSGTSDKTLSEGIHVKNILDKVYKISTEVQTVNVKNLTSQTKDAQFVNSELDIKFRVSETNAYVVFKQFRKLNTVGEKLIVPTTQRVLELITTKYNVMDILGESRSDIYNELTVALTTEFAQYGIEFYSISIIDMDAGEAIEAAITAEAVAKKSVETAEQELARAKTEAQQKSVQAQAEQDAAKIAAETKLIEAEAEQKANEMKNISLSEAVLRQQWIEKWNGQMPTYYGGDGNLLIQPE